MLADLVGKNRTCRSFDPDRKVTEEDLHYMMDCARLTASSQNRQGVRYIPILEEEEVQILHEETHLGALLPELHLPPEGMEPSAYIILCLDREITKGQSNFLKDIGIAAQTVTLAATERDLGACMIGNFSPKKVSERLGIPDGIEPNLIIAVGGCGETFVIEEIHAGESTNYYRDADGVHHVPKLALEDVIVKR